MKFYASFYKQHRGLLHSGTVVRDDITAADAMLYGTVALDKSEAIFTFMQLETFNDFLPRTARFDGLLADALYKVEVVTELSAPIFMQRQDPGWWPTVTLPGDVLANVGLQMPGMLPESGLLFHITKI